MTHDDRRDATVPDLFEVPSSVTSAACEHLGVEGVVPDLAGLGVLYQAWCRTVPFDNVRKRLFQIGGAVGDVPGATAAIFLDDLLFGGTGGTCWSTSMGLVAVARSLGFEADLVPGVMHTEPGLRPNHASVIVRLGRERYLLDTSMLFERPLLLGTVTTGHDGVLHPVTAVPGPEAGSWTVSWLPGHSRRRRIDCDVTDEPAVDADVWRWHERTRADSLFNHQLFLRRNKDGGIVSYGRGSLVEVDASGETQRRPISRHDRDAVVSHIFGVDLRIIAQVPHHEAGPAFL